MKEGFEMDNIEQMLNKIKNRLLDFGFKRVQINGDINYVLGNLYCIPFYLKSIGFIIEYAHSLEEAQKNMHGDGDAFPLEMGEEAILSGIEEEIRGALKEDKH
jgi:hypothetical protein